MRWLFWRKKKKTQLSNELEFSNQLNLEEKVEAIPTTETEQITEIADTSVEIDIPVKEEVKVGIIEDIPDNIDVKLPGKEKTTTDKTNPNYHVSMNHDETSKFYNMWRVRKEKSRKTIKHFKTQKEAIDYASILASKLDAKVVIHKVDGKIRKQNYTKEA